MKKIKESKGQAARSTTKNISIAEFKRGILGFEEKGVEASTMIYLFFADGGSFESLK